MGREATVALVCGGRWHDFDYAQHELVDLLSSFGVTPRVVEDYAALGSLDGLQLLVTYTCDVRPDLPTQQRLQAHIREGGRWLALHATNAALDPPDVLGEAPFVARDVMPVLVDVLGSRFLGHPPITPWQVAVTDSHHPLVAGIEPFEVRDELYVSELSDDMHVLLHTDFAGPCPGFSGADADPDRPRQPVLYVRSHGQGQVCYLTLGHCRGRHDLRDLGVEDTGVVDRGSWTVPEFRAILARAVRQGLEGTGWLMPPSSAR